ncbi:glutamate racemase [Propylenella binzhouense]|uniref:Glutamate racemase n=1 Tax=Propylenella binzhouense TaxID=2555902 RepID=A0A964WTP7_9HYPH|nr:glutamate racemase [Propylenella binzhouense]MYZ48065.1 glutamate racemase [Propylenella binzhouense]
MTEAKPVIVFDSGVGGLSVHRAIRERLPDLPVLYVADDAAFPYGDWEEGALVDHVVALMADLVAAHDPAAVVIACNTASTLVLPPLRARFDIPFVGTVPAVKPAAERTRTGVIAVLATPGTMRRDYTRELIRTYAKDCHVRLVGAPDLAAIAEAHMRGEPVDEAAVRAQIEPCFIEVDGARTDIVVLGCTHYPFLRTIFERVAPWPVTWIDPAAAIARRLEAVLGAGREGGTAPSFAVFTSGRRPPPRLERVLARLGLPVGNLTGAARTPK